MSEAGLLTFWEGCSEFDGIDPRNHPKGHGEHLFYPRRHAKGREEHLFEPGRDAKGR